MQRSLPPAQRGLQRPSRCLKTEPAEGDMEENAYVPTAPWWLPCCKAQSCPETVALFGPLLFFSSCPYYFNSHAFPLPSAFSARCTPTLPSIISQVPLIHEARVAISRGTPGVCIQLVQSFPLPSPRSSATLRFLQSQGLTLL